LSATEGLAASEDGAVEGDSGDAGAEGVDVAGATAVDAVGFGLGDAAGVAQAPATTRTIAMTAVARAGDDERGITARC
jgi:hypothetical protein